MSDTLEPVAAGQLHARLAHRYTQLKAVASTGSTNADLRAEAAAGAPDRSVLIAEQQTAGLGRRSRNWTSPPGGLYLSVLVRPAEVPAERLGSLTVIAGLALLRTVRAFDVDAVLKWPNDLLAGPSRAKCAGILCEAVAEPELAVVVGIGVNTAPLGEPISGPGGLPATSLSEQGVGATRTEIVGELLMAFDELEADWRRAAGDLAAAGLLEAYRQACDTLGREVRIEGVGESVHEGHAVDIDSGGALLLRGPNGEVRAFSAGDVVHLRPIME